MVQEQLELQIAEMEGRNASLEAKNAEIERMAMVQEQYCKQVSR